jgi:streptomycin 6-kinase
MRIPEALVETWAHEAGWLAALPGLVAELAAEWELVLEQPLDTPHSLVIRAGDAVLKLNAPSHVETDTEADALARWGGEGAVRLLARDDARRALLIERCVPGTRLWDAGVDEAEAIATLLPRLQVEVRHPHPFTFLADEADRWAEDVPSRYAAAGNPFERELIDLALDTFRTVDRRASFLVNQDLHGGNVLAAEREPWLVIDPKPLAGERELDGSGLLRNARDPSRWLDVLADLGLDRERSRAWGVAHNLAWAWDEVRLEWHENHVEEARRILRAR